MKHTFLTLTEAEELDALVEDGRDLDRAVLQSFAFNDPPRIEAVRDQHRNRVRRLADPDGTRTAARAARARAEGETLIVRAGAFGDLPGTHATSATQETR